MIESKGRQEKEEISSFVKEEDESLLELLDEEWSATCAEGGALARKRGWLEERSVQRVKTAVIKRFG